MFAVLAAVLSTVASIVLVFSSVLAYDLCGSLVAAVPLGFALQPGLLDGPVKLMLALYLTPVTGALLVPVLLGSHRERVTTPAAPAGVLMRAAAVACWHLLTDATATVGPPSSALLPVVVGIAGSGFVAVTGSLLWPASTD